MENPIVENKKKYIGVLGAFALSIGTAIGWGSFVVTGSDYLSEAGLLGSMIGIVLGALLMGVIAYCYHYMMNKVPDSGGIYSFVKHTFNGDHAFLASWFLIIVYTGILWANVTSVALFSRFLLGNVFQFGRLYTIAGYDVYIGEVLLCAGVLFLIGGLTFLNKKITTRIAFGLAAIFISAIIFVTLFCLVAQNGFSFSEAAFAPTGKNQFGQIMSVLAMTPWAFIGFESISHSTGSFSFKTKRTIIILLVSLFVATMMYILLCTISVLAHPDVYSSWYDYITNNREAGIMGIPPFFVAHYYMGDAGVAIFGIALFAIIATSIIGNIYALTNLIHRMAEDGLFPKAFTYVNKNDIPVNVRVVVIGLTFFAIFLGRATIGFIVDVNNIGGVIVYTYVSACAAFVGFRKRERVAMVFGILGIVSSIVFGIAHLAPIFTTEEKFANETFIVFIIFSLVGFAFFTMNLRKDTKGTFGNSSIVWIGFSILITFFSGMWIIERSKSVHGTLLAEIQAYYESLHGGQPDKSYLAALEANADYKNMTGIITLIVIVSLTLLILFLTLYFVKENEKKHKQQLDTVSVIANRDALTGVGNNRAYVANERRIIAKLANDPNYEFGIVVCDVNDLKYINDRYGHDYGDEYIRKACHSICLNYKMSPVFRVGGDEFVVILEGADYENREALLAKLQEMSLENTKQENGIVIASGMATKGVLDDFNAVFHKADKLMYAHKEELKKKRPSHNLR